MGQFSVKIYTSPGSLLSANQQYTPIQRPDSTWVRCIRTSSYTVSCIAY